MVTFERTTNRLLALRRGGVKIFSLRDVFSSQAQPLYADSIHVKREAGGDSLGYKMIAARMAELLGEAWGLTRRKS
jgi:hypothetical protein